MTRTYQIFAGYWPNVTDPGHPIAGQLNALPKYVASTTLTSADWHNSSLLGGDVVAETTKLKEQPGGELQVRGSGALAHTLIEHDLTGAARLLHARPAVSRRQPCTAARSPVRNCDANGRSLDNVRWIITASPFSAQSAAQGDLSR